MKTYKKPSDLYNQLLKDSAKLFQEWGSGAVIIDNQKLSSLINENGWEKLLLDRYIKHKIIDGYTDITGNIHTLETDQIQRLRGLISLLSFDTDFLRKERQKRRVYGETLEPLVYNDDDIKIKYGFKNQGAKKLIIIFQPKWAKTEYIFPNSGKITHDSYEGLFQYNTYQFVGRSQEYTDYDFVFIQDDFNLVYGWFTTNYGKLIYRNLQRFIELLSEPYDKTVLVGASKGAYGAYHLGKDLSCIDTIIGIGPILSMGDYSEEVDNSTLKYTVENNYFLLEQIKLREQVPPNSNIKIIFSSGKKDYQIKLIEELSNKYKNIKLFRYDDFEDHGKIIENSYKDMFSYGLSED